MTTDGPRAPDAPGSSNRAAEIFADALDCATDELPGFLERECAGDPGLRAEVEALLDADRNAGEFLEEPVLTPETDGDDGPLDPAGADPPFPFENTPSRLAQYNLLRLIGTGGMGVVYEAIQRQPSRTVALKLIRRGVTSRSALRRLELEAELLGRLQHPGIAQVFEAGSFDEGDGAGEQPFFAMEYIRGARSLTEFAAANALSTRQRLELFALVCDAVHHGHTRGVIHLDLKPSNILVDGEGRPKIIDFGVARLTDADATLTMDAGHLAGTLQYMSPEQTGTVDPKDLDDRADIYALGVVLYELVCGCLPYDLRNAALPEAARRIREQPPEPPSRVVPTIARDLETVILTALQKDPDRRYQSAAQLKGDVERLLAGRPIVARRDSRVYTLLVRARSAAASNPAIALVLAAVVAFVLAGQVGGRVVFGTKLNLVYERAFGAVNAALAAPSLDSVRVIAHTEETDNGALAQRAGVPYRDDVGWGTRALHGPMLRRLAAAGVRAVVLDVAFTGPSEYDEHLIEGIRAVNEAGGIVIAATAGADWAPGEAGAPFSPAIARHVRLGAAMFQPFTPERVRVELAMAHGPDNVVPSMVFAAFAALRHPDAEPMYTLLPAAGVVQVEYALPRSNVPGTRQRLPDVDRVPTAIIDEEPEDDPELGVGRGDLAAGLLIEMPPLEALEGVTVPYEDVLTASDDALRAAFGGRIAIYGDFTADDYLDGEARRVHGSYGHAVALAALLSQAYVRSMSEWHYNLMAALGAAVGVVAPLAARRTRRRMLVLALLAAAIVAVAAVVLRVERLWLDPVVPIIALAIGAALSGAINRARLAHRLS